MRTSVCLRWLQRKSSAGEKPKEEEEPSGNMFGVQLRKTSNPKIEQEMQQLKTSERIWLT